MGRARAARLCRGDRDLEDLVSRLTIWEDAADRGYVARETLPGMGLIIAVTEDGEKFLRTHGR